MPPLSMATASEEAARGPRGPIALALLSLLGVLLFVGFIALGTWQVERRAWKLDLIAKVDQRVQAPATALPDAAQWPQVTAATDEYRHVRATGTFLHDQQTLVWASTARGNGYWVMTPLRMADGTVVLINRGFVLPDWCGRAGQCGIQPAGATTVTGLLRMSETHVFLRHNDPIHERWYARDVQAIAVARGLDRVAPFFVDADTTGRNDAAIPEGGMTVISFPNNHLVYLITWYFLALMVLTAAIYVGRDEYRLRRAARKASASIR